MAGVTQHSFSTASAVFLVFRFLELLNKTVIRKYHQFNGNLCCPGKKLLLKRGGPGLPINEELAQRQEAKNRNVWSFFCVT